MLSACYCWRSPAVNVSHSGPGEHAGQRTLSGRSKLIPKLNSRDLHSPTQRLDRLNCHLRRVMPLRVAGERLQMHPGGEVAWPSGDIVARRGPSMGRTPRREGHDDCAPCRAIRIVAGSSIALFVITRLWRRASSNHSARPLGGTRSLRSPQSAMLTVGPTGPTIPETSKSPADCIKWMSLTAIALVAALYPVKARLRARAVEECDRGLFSLPWWLLPACWFWTLVYMTFWVVVTVILFFLTVACVRSKLEIETEGPKEEALQRGSRPS
jgi:hypothetical protein